MNKLVSRNPVLRFKLGRKIIIALLGDKMIYNGNEIVTKEILDGQPIYRRKNGTYIYSNNKLLSPIKASLNNINNQQQKYSPGWISNISSLILNNILNILKSAQKSNLKEIVTLPKSSVLDINGNKGGNSEKRTSLTNNRWVNGILRRNEITDVRATQLMLKDAGFDIGKYGVDGKWGKDTEAAYLKYLSIKNIPHEENLILTLEPVTTTPIIQPTPEAKAIISGLDYSDKWKYPEMNVSIPENYVPNSLKANRSDIREVIRRATGKGAYDFTGALRKALRLYINGEQYNADDLAAFGNLDIFNKYKPGFYKQGGNVLPSRNIIKRFKVAKALKGLKTAPRAEDRYKNSERYDLWIGPEGMYNEKSVKTNDLIPGWITQTIRYTPMHKSMDTTYTETPPTLFPLKRLKRIAIRNGEWKGNSFVSNPKEYEILKRRFNTAWNLAK